MKLHALLLSLLLAAQYAPAQQLVPIHGRLVSAINGEPLVKMRVALSPTSLEVETNQEGGFDLNYLPIAIKDSLYLYISQPSGQSQRIIPIPKAEIPDSLTIALDQLSPQPMGAQGNMMFSFATSVKVTDGKPLSRAMKRKVKEASRK